MEFVALPFPVTSNQIWCRWSVRWLSLLGFRGRNFDYFWKRCLFAPLLILAEPSFVLCALLSSNLLVRSAVNLFFAILVICKKEGNNAWPPRGNESHKSLNSNYLTSRINFSFSLSFLFRRYYTENHVSQSLILPFGVLLTIVE